MLTLQERKEKAHGLADIFLSKVAPSSEEARIVFYNIIDMVIEDAAVLREAKADKSDLKELIAVLEKRFGAMDKRFEDMQNYMERRFEDMQNYMERRFEAVDKRFESVDKRFSMLQWMIGFGFTLITVALTIVQLYVK